MKNHRPGERDCVEYDIKGIDRDTRLAAYVTSPQLDMLVHESLQDAAILHWGKGLPAHGIQPETVTPVTHSLHEARNSDQAFDFEHEFYKSQDYKVDASYQLDKLQVIALNLQRTQYCEIDRKDDQYTPFALEFTTRDIKFKEWNDMIGELKACGYNPGKEEVWLNADTFEPIDNQFEM